MYILITVNNNDAELPRAFANLDDAVTEMKRDFAEVVRRPVEEVDGYDEHNGSLSRLWGWFDEDDLKINWEIFEFKPLTMEFTHPTLDLNGNEEDVFLW